MLCVRVWWLTMQTSEADTNPTLIVRHLAISLSPPEPQLSIPFIKWKILWWLAHKILWGSVKSRKSWEPCLLSTNVCEMLAVNVISFDPLRINKPLREKLRIRVCKYQGFTPTYTGEKLKLKWIWLHLQAPAVILGLAKRYSSIYF